MLLKVRYKLTVDSELKETSIHLANRGKHTQDLKNKKASVLKHFEKEIPIFIKYKGKGLQYVILRYANLMLKSQEMFFFYKDLLASIYAPHITTIKAKKAAIYCCEQIIEVEQLKKAVSYKVLSEHRKMIKIIKRI